MKIYSKKCPINPETPYIFLDATNWDDYSYKSTFDVYYYNSIQKIYIGEIKIINSEIDIGRVEVKNKITKLPYEMCSLGQTREYYLKLKKLPKNEYIEILTTLRDCAYDKEIYNLFRDLEQFKSSAVRFSKAEQALELGREIFSNRHLKSIKPSYSFTFNTTPKGFESPLNLKFKFFNSSEKKIPSNINVLIGRNGTGKTQVLSELAKSISGYGYETREDLIKSKSDQLNKSSSAFGHVIVVSYSAFDNFEIPGKNQEEINSLTSFGHIHGYKYCGLRERIGDGEYKLKSMNEITKNFEESLAKLEKSKHYKRWNSCIKHILNDKSFHNFNKGSLIKKFRSLSSGQKIVLSILASVYDHIEKNSLVIIDEPETHLHPSLISAFLHSIREILKYFESYAIIATHSPVILQETPSMFVQVLGGSSRAPTVKRLKLESFGEEISTLTEEVFHVSFEESNFYTTLNSLSQEGHSIEEIERLFSRRLSFTAKSFIETL